MYGIDQNTDSEGFVSNYMPAGIHENVKLSNVAYENAKEDGSGQMVLAFHFVDEDKNTLRHVEFPIDPQQIKSQATSTPRQHGRNNAELGYVKGQNITPDQAVQIEVANQATRIKHIMTKYMPEQQTVTGAVQTFEQYANAIIAKFNAVADYSQKLVRLKVVKPGEYSKLPRFAPFMETMDIPKEESKLAFTQYEKQQMETKPSADEDFGETADTLDDDAKF